MGFCCVHTGAEGTKFAEWFQTFVYDRYVWGLSIEKNFKFFVHSFIWKFTFKNVNAQNNPVAEEVLFEIPWKITNIKK